MESAAERYIFRGSHGEAFDRIGGDVKNSLMLLKLSLHSLVQANGLDFEADLMASYIGRHFFG